MPRVFILAFILALIGLGFWEIYVREMGYHAAVRDDKALWGVQRAKVKNLEQDDVIILGSSRAHFTIQIDEWEQETGIRPIMLASDGTTSTPVFLDVVENIELNGAIIIGIPDHFPSILQPIARPVTDRLPGSWRDTVLRKPGY